MITTLGTGMRAGNYPMAIDPSGTRIAVAYRFPSSLSVFEAASGAPVFSASICGDADDLFFQGSRLVVVCGEGAVELIEQQSEHRKIRLATSRGARTGIVFPERNQLLLGVPGQGDGAAIWELAFR